VPDDLDQSTITVDISVGEKLAIGSGVVVELLAKSGRHARLRLRAPRDEKIERQPAIPLPPSMAR